MNLVLSSIHSELDLLPAESEEQTILYTLQTAASSLALPSEEEGEEGEEEEEEEEGDVSAFLILSRLLTLSSSLSAVDGIGFFFSDMMILIPSMKWEGKVKQSKWESKVKQSKWEGKVK